MTNFWSGFEKKAAEGIYASAKWHKPKPTEQGNLPLEGVVTTGGPRLDSLTGNSDRRKFRTFKG